MSNDRRMRVLLGAAMLGGLWGCAGSAELDAEARELAGRDLSRPTFTSAEGVDDPAARVPGAIVVDFKDGTTKAEFDGWEKAWGIDLEFASEEEGPQDGITVAVGVDDVESELAEIRTNPNVESAEPLMTYSATYVPNDPLYEKQWNLKQIDMPAAWERTRGKGVVVAVLDTGIAYETYGEFRQVPDLKGAKFAKGYDFVNKDSHPNDDHGHGTHVAGTIAQATNNGEGVAGVAFEATLMPVKVLNHFGSGTSADIADAIRWAADHGANVINMSLGGGGRSAIMESAVMYARKKGVVVVAAAGNTGQPRVEYPAAYPGTVAVAAVGPNGERAPYSSYGKELDLAAPGGDKRGGDESGIIQNTIDPRDPSRSVYAAYQGTSMATPHVAGVAALLFASGAKTPDQVEKALFAGAKPANGQSGWNEVYGHGLLNAARSLKALRALEAGDSAVAQVPTTVQTEQQAPVARGWRDVVWSPLAWAAVALAVVLLSITAKQRPGYLNVFLHPKFLVPVLAATVGVFFLRWLAGASELAQTLTLPIPDWSRIIFGRGKLANPLFYSALIPLLVSFVAIKWKGLRPVVAGLAIGFAGFLGYSAWAHAPALSWLPFTFLAIPWLVVNALVCLVVARAMLRKAAP